MQQILIVYPFFPHYRRGVFLALDQDPGADMVFAGDRFGRLGIEVMDTDQLSDFVRLRTRRWRAFDFQPGLVRLLVSRPFDAVVFLGDAKVVSTWIGALVARLRGIRVFYWTIGWHRPERGAKRLTRLAFYRLANTLLLYGNVGREIGTAMGYPTHRMVVIGNSISLSSPGEPQPDVIDSPPAGDQIRVGAVARITSTKRFDLLIEACAILRRRGLNAVVKLAGEGPALQGLRTMALQTQVPLHLTPPIYRADELATFYTDLDATVVPQAIGLTVIQSLGFGVPAISDDNPHTQMPEWESIIPGTTGELYAEGDAESLAEAIMRAWTLRRAAPTSDACRAEYEERWSPGVHARNVINAICAP